MREIKIRVPRGHAESVFRLAQGAGIADASSHQVRVHGGGEDAEELKIKAATPKIKAFLGELFRAPFYDRRLYPFSSHELRALVAGEPSAEATRPVFVPFPDIQQDLWQYTHVTWSFAIRSAVSAGLLAYALIKDDKVLSVGAMIFSPFSPLILAIAFGAASSCGRLAAQSLKALGAALLLTFGASAAAAAAAGGPLLFQDFGGLKANLAMSAAIGLLAAAADADDVGRRQLIGLAMAYPFVKFPVWIGIAAVLGFPPAAVTARRLAALGGNALLMTGVAALTYRAMARGGELRDLPE